MKKIKKFWKEILIPLISAGKISIETAKSYKSIAHKILTDKEYLKKAFSKHSLRRISRVLSLLNKIVDLIKKSKLGRIFALKSGAFVADTKTFLKWADFNFLKHKKYSIKLFQILAKI